MKPYTQSFKTILLALILSFGISFVFAWTGPTTTPPAGNTSAPINTSADTQYKGGGLGFGGIIHGYNSALFDGNVGIDKGGWLTLKGTGAGADPATRIGIYDTDNTGGVTGWYLSQNQDGKFAIHQNGVGDRLNIDGSGNVGIGTTAPGAKLEVNGNTKISGDLVNNGYKFVLSPIITYGSGVDNYYCCGGGAGKADTCNSDNIGQYTCSGSPKKCNDVYGVGDYWSCGYCGKLIGAYREVDCGTTASVSAVSQ